MPALFINIKIDHHDRLDRFKVTLADLEGLFDEYHIKIRGVLGDESIAYAKDLFASHARFYQELQESDWVAASHDMLAQVTSRSVFLYCEDHKLVADRQRLGLVLKEFDENQLDHLSYSFFHASQLDVRNLLPLNPRRHSDIIEFSLNEQSRKMIGRISPRYCIYSNVSISSVEYFRSLLQLENKKYKFYFPKLTKLIIRLFPYPGYRKVFDRINNLSSSMSIRLCASSPASPFNMEKNWHEAFPLGKPWKFGVLRNELFANYDDDNGSYGESLIKKGGYPFDAQVSNPEIANGLTFSLRLQAGEIYDCNYYSHNGRIGHAPQVSIRVIDGDLQVAYAGEQVYLRAGDIKSFYSNIGPVIECKKDSQLEIAVFDEAFA
jgi:hypothetical protein